MCGALAISEPCRIEQRAGEIQPLLDVHRVRRVLQRSPICSAMFMNRLLNSSSMTGSGAERRPRPPRTPPAAARSAIPVPAAVILARHPASTRSCRWARRRWQDRRSMRRASSRSRLEEPRRRASPPARCPRGNTWTFRPRFRPIAPRLRRLRRLRADRGLLGIRPPYRCTRPPRTRSTAPDAASGRRSAGGSARSNSHRIAAAASIGDTPASDSAAGSRHGSAVSVP